MRRRTHEQVLEDIEAGSKVCGKCGKRKPFSEFTLQNGRGDGHYAYCRSCENKGIVRNKIDVTRDIELQTKVCKLCGERKPFSEYSTGITSDGCDTYCKRCRSVTNSHRQTLKKYNLTEEEYQEIISRGCEVCSSKENLCIDHCHTTGEVRGCLCSNCNTALGLMHDNPDNIIKLSEYIERTGKTEEV